MWASNLAIFGILVGLSTGFFSSWNKRSVSAIIGVSVLILFPVISSELIYRNYDEKSEGRLDVAIARSISILTRNFRVCLSPGRTGR